MNTVHFRRRAEAFADALCSDRWKGTRRRSGDEVRGACPIQAHDEKTPGAFGYNADKDCYACRCGAGTGSALRALLGHCHHGGRDDASQPPPSRPISSRQKRVYRDTGAVAKELARRLSKRETGRWTYTGNAGDPLFAILRFDGEELGPDGETRIVKVYRPIHVVPGGWSIGDPPGNLPLYDLPRVMASSSVVTVEGEKCVEALRRVGIVATTSAHGAKSAEKSDWQTLAGKTVWILPDADKAGHEYAESVTQLLRVLRPPVVPCQIDLPGLLAGEDVADFISKREAEGKLLADIRTEIESILGAGDDVPSPELIRLSDVVPKVLTFIRPGMWPRGKVVLLSGDPDCGKSQIVTDAMSRISTGASWPEGDQPAPKGTSILLAGEDDLADTILPRVMAAGGDPSKIVILRSKRGSDGKSRPISLADISTIEAALRRNPDAVLVGVDPLFSFLGGREANKNEQIRELLTPLADLAGRFNITILAINHLNKLIGGKAMYRSSGGLSFIAAARAAFLVTADPNDRDHRRLMLPVKCNLARRPLGLAYRIAEVELPGLGVLPRLEWERDPIRKTADEVLAAEIERPKALAKDRARGWIENLLAGGPVLADDVEKDREIRKIGRDAMYAAAEELGVIRDRSHFGGPVYWRLPSRHPSQSSETSVHPGAAVTGQGASASPSRTEGGL
jgi:putative DNA primase/helicase